MGSDQWDKWDWFYVWQWGYLIRLSKVTQLQQFEELRSYRRNDVWFVLHAKVGRQYTLVRLIPQCCCLWEIGRRTGGDCETVVKSYLY
jgi:hypothetical protein